MGERDFIALVDGVHQLVKAPVPGTLDGFIAGTGLTLDAPVSP